MRAVVQRVTFSDVEVENNISGKIDTGLNVLLGVSEDDSEADAVYMADKVCGLRIFEDENEKMNLSVKDVGGSILAISQFTLFGDTRHGKRPSFIEAARPEKAEQLYELFTRLCRERDVHVEEGIFRTHMTVRIKNDGPVTILIDSKKKF